MTGRRFRFHLGALLGDERIDHAHDLGSEHVGLVVETGAGVDQGIDAKRRRSLAPVDAGLCRLAVLEFHLGRKRHLYRVRRAFGLLHQRAAHFLHWHDDLMRILAHRQCERFPLELEPRLAHGLAPGQLTLPPSILRMSSSRQVLTMSQETFSPLGSRVATISQIFFLHSFRASFSAASSGVSCRLASLALGGAACSAGGCAWLCAELSSASSAPGAMTRVGAAIRAKKRLIFLRLTYRAP